MPAAAATWRRRFRSFAAAGLVFVFLSGTVHFLLEAERDRLEQDVRADLTQSALLLLSRLDGELNANVYLANGLLAFVTGDQLVVDERFQQALHALFQHGRNLRSLAMAPNNRITYVYPRQGNEAALGLFYPDNPRQWAGVQLAMTRKQTVLVGPLPLKQGGTGIMSRTPVYLANGRYWGMLTLVLDMESLFQSVGLREEVEGIRYALRGRDAQGEDGEVFFGDPDLFAGDSIKLNLAVAGGNWQLAAAPAAGWHAGQTHLTVLEGMALLLNAFLAWLVFSYQEVRLRTFASERRLRTFLETTQDGVIVIDDGGIVQEFNPAAETLFGYLADEIVGKSVNKLMPSADAVRHDQFVRNPSQGNVRAMAAGRRIDGLRKDGTLFPVEVTVGTAMLGRQRLHVAIVRDIAERLAYEQKLLDLATTDGLTGILNRRAFLERAQGLLAMSRRNGQPLAAFLIDADHFKRINDNYGHAIGDRVLVELAAVIGRALRSTDLYGRFGGEEFIALLPETDFRQASEAAERLLRDVRSTQLTTDDGRSINFTVSIGIAINVPLENIALETLIGHADQALYRAKENGRDRWAGGADN